MNPVIGGASCYGSWRLIQADQPAGSSRLALGDRRLLGAGSSSGSSSGSGDKDGASLEFPFPRLVERIRINFQFLVSFVCASRTISYCL